MACVCNSQMRRQPDRDISVHGWSIRDSPQVWAVVTRFLGVEILCIGRDLGGRDKEQTKVSAACKGCQAEV